MLRVIIMHGIFVTENRSFQYILYGFRQLLQGRQSFVA